MKLTVDLGPNSYPIHIENGILAKTGELVSEVFSGRKIMIVSDDNAFSSLWRNYHKSIV